MGFNFCRNFFFEAASASAPLFSKEFRAEIWEKVSI
jgi:hypothetical protein